MSFKVKKIICFDLDGTILLNRRIFSKVTQLINSLSNDYLIVFSSARDFDDIKNILFNSGIKRDTIIISQNGYQINTKFNKTCFIGDDIYLNKLLVEKLDRLSKMSSRVLIYEESKKYIIIRKSLLNSFYKLYFRFRNCHFINTFNSIEGKKIKKVAIFPRLSNSNNLNENGLNFISFDKYTLVQHKSRDKVYALDYLVQLYNLADKNVLVLGNDFNDLLSLVKYESIIVGKKIRIPGKRYVQFKESHIIKPLLEFLGEHYEAK